MSEPEIVEGEIEYSESDKADLLKLGIVDGEQPSYHTILEVWREVLRPAQKEVDAKISPNWANRVTQSYREVDFADMGYFQESYFTKLLRLAGMLEEEIAKDSDALTWATPEEDVKENRQHYLDVLLNWQLEILQWELDWDWADPKAGVELAAISEIHKMFFGAEGLTAFLESVRFEYTEDDQLRVHDALVGLRGED